MGLFQKACETYDNHQNLVGVYEEGKVPLAPVAHRTIKTDVLEFNLNADGTLRGIDEIKDDCFILPVTIDSDNRTSSNAEEVPHPLCDKLLYFNPTNKKGYVKYVQQLEEWCVSSCAVPMLKAILMYVKKGTVIEDLVNYQIDYKNKMYVRWRVVGLGENEIAECWRNKKLFDSWQKYYESTVSKSKFAGVGICMISGAEEIIQLKHTGIVGKSKIISDKYDYRKNKEEDTAFVYTGRFDDVKEACTVGYLSSQKFHNVIRWQIIRGVSKNSGGKIRKFFCWNPKGRKIPSCFEPLKEFQDARIKPSDYGVKLREVLSGYRNDLPKTEDVIVLSLDAVSKGRASITYYNEIKASDFLDRIEHWYGTFCWNHWKYGVSSPSIDKILKVAFGREEKVKSKDKKFELVVNDKIVCDAYQELLNCILMRRIIPRYIVDRIFVNVSRPQSYNWSKHRYTVYDDDVLFTACAVMRKYLNDKCKKEEWSMELEKEKNERNYLFGRLLAVMEKVELDTYDEDEDREPNAIRMQSAFCEKPYSCFKLIHEMLAPYFAKLSPRRRSYYKRIIGEIVEKLAELDEKELNKPLKEPYLLGYYLQRNDLYKSKKNSSEEENENDDVEE